MFAHRDSDSASPDQGEAQYGSGRQCELKIKISYELEASKALFFTGGRVMTYAARPTRRGLRGAVKFALKFVK